MEGMYSAGCVALLITNLLIGFTFTEELTENSPENWLITDVHWHPRKHPPRMLFFPFRGRSKRSSSYDDFDKSSPYERPQVDSLIHSPQEAPWSMILLNEGKRHVVSFAPRLGRESAEEDTEDWIQQTDLNEIMLHRSPPFAPRLGRRFPLTPRLGRHNDKHL